MKKLLPSALLFLFVIIIASCKSDINDEEPGKITCNYKLAIALKWYNTYTTVDTYTSPARTEKISSVTTSPVGFFKVFPDGTYEVVANEVPKVGKWEINEKCQLVLDSTVIRVKRDFEIVNITPQSLVLRFKDGEKVYTQHYKSADCPAITQLSKRWDNTETYFFDYDAASLAVTNPTHGYPVGYFNLNSDFTYNVLSDNVPLDGSWALGEPYCVLNLDAKKINERSFEIVKLTTDSLVLWRKDAVMNKAYLQYYLKH